MGKLKEEKRTLVAFFKSKTRLFLFVLRHHWSQEVGWLDAKQDGFTPNLARLQLQIIAPNTTKICSPFPAGPFMSTLPLFLHDFFEDLSESRIR